MNVNIPKVLSIQSHVAYGYAGNKAAVFPMQRLGIEVSPIYTVQLSNHTQYDFFKGSFFSAEDIQNVIDGMISNGFLEKQDAILSGYIGNVDIAKVIANTVILLKEKNKLAYTAVTLYLVTNMMKMKQGIFLHQMTILKSS